MYSLLILVSCLLHLSQGASSGAAACDVLGMCRMPGISTEDGTKCPAGMEKVSPPVRSNFYTIRSADSSTPNTDPTSYVPGQIMDIHLRVHQRNAKYLGVLMYAVEAGVHPKEGCPDGCNGSQEDKVGSWVITDTSNFQHACGNDQALTHTDASLKRYHHVFRWRAPEPGVGNVIFRALVKYGATQGGAFYWPNEDFDLELTQGSAPEPTILWKRGNSGQTCSQTCRETSHTFCDASADGTLSAVYEEVKKTESCRLPLLSSCTTGAFSVDSDGYCYFGHEGNTFCPNTEYDVCSTSNLAGDYPLCPCSKTASSSSSGAVRHLSFINLIVALSLLLI